MALSFNIVLYLDKCCYFITDMKNPSGYLLQYAGDNPEGL